MTVAHGAWWCLHHRHWRSGSPHLSPQSRVCADDGHCEVMQSLTRSFPFTHSHSKINLRAKPKTHQTGCIQLVVLFPPAAVQSGGWHPWRLLPAPQGLPTLEAFSPKTVLEKTVGTRVRQKLHHSRPTLPFLITYKMTVHPSLLERLARLTPGDSATCCLMMSSSRTLQVRPSTSFPTVQSLCRWQSL